MTRKFFFGKSILMITAAAGVFRPIGNIFFGTGLESRLFTSLLMLALLIILMDLTVEKTKQKIISVEIILFFLWICWALLTGDFEEAVGYMSVSGVFRNVGLAGITLLVSTIFTIKAGSFRYVAAGCLIAGSLLILFSLVYGGFSNIGSMTNYRLGNNAGNANEWGYVFLISFFGSIILATDHSLKDICRVIAIIAAIVFVAGIVFTGSRKAFIGALAFMFLGQIFVQGSKRVFTVMGIVIRLMIMFLLYFIWSFVLQHSFLGERLLETQTIEDLAVVEQERLGNYYQLVHVIKEEPLAGVGLAHWQRIAWSGKASHSEYVSVLGETGLVGGALYFSLYVILLMRLINLTRHLHASKIKQQTTIPLLLSSLIVLLFVAIGRWNFTNAFHSAFIGGMIGICIDQSLRWRGGAKWGKGEQDGLSNIPRLTSRKWKRLKNIKIK